MHRVLKGDFSVGPIKVWFDYPSYEEIARLYPYLEPGGHSKPDYCLARHRVAIIVPYRDRDQHLRGFLHNMHSLLTKQQLDYAIFIVEQKEEQTFNRAKLMNVGFAEANKLYDFQCYIFHDVDLLPEDDRNLYSCPEQPRHMSVAVDKFKYQFVFVFAFLQPSTSSKYNSPSGCLMAPYSEASQRSRKLSSRRLTASPTTTGVGVARTTTCPPGMFHVSPRCRCVLRVSLL